MQSGDGLKTQLPLSMLGCLSVPKETAQLGEEVVSNAAAIRMSRNTPPKHCSTFKKIAANKTREEGWGRKLQGITRQKGWGENRRG